MSGETTLTIIGNLTRDPEVRFLESGVAVCKFTVASTPRRYDAKTGKWVDGETVFMPVTAWRDLAEHVGNSLSQGDRAIVTGSLKLDRWESPEGDKRERMVMTADEAGPSLRWSDAKPVRTERRTSGAADDTWLAASSKRPEPAGVGASTGSGFDGEPPF